MNLTEYELVDLAINVQASTTSGVSLFITILSGYLIVAWLVGEKLTRAQVRLINVIFILFQAMLIWAWSGRWGHFHKFYAVLTSIDSTFYEAPSRLATAGMGVIMFMSIFACLKFMWDIRHPKTE